MRLIWKDIKHLMEITKDDNLLILSHRGEVLIEVHNRPDEIKVLKKLYNLVVDNHNSIEGYFENEELLL